MITFEKRGGWANDAGNIHYVSFWSKELNKRSPLRFYEGDVGLVVDAVISGDNIKIIHYPHNSATITQIATSFETEIVALVTKMRATFPNRTRYTISLETIPSLVLVESFTGYFMNQAPKDELVIFEKEKDDEGFPIIYAFDAHQKTANKDVGYVMNRCAAFIADCAGEPTELGKELVFILFNSQREGEFTARCVGGFSSAAFPTRGNGEIPNYVSTKALRAFADECSAHSKVTVKDGVTTFEEDDTVIDLKAEEVDEDDDEMVDEFPPAISAPLLPPPSVNIQEHMTKQLLDKESLNLGDIFMLGLSETMALVPFRDKIIEVNLDLTGIGRKACIFEGQFHLIPLTRDFDPEEFFGEPMEMFHICDESTFPKKSSATQTTYIQ